MCVRAEPKEVHLTRGSPLCLIVAPAEAVAHTSRCLATPSECEILSGEESAFTVKTCDRFGNACDCGGAQLTLAAPSVARGDVTYQVVDQGDGEYTVLWSSAVAGMHEVSVQLDGEPLGSSSSPHLRLHVTPNALCVKTSKLSGDGLTRAVAGESTIIHIHAKDAYGNAVLPLPELHFGISLWDTVHELMLPGSNSGASGNHCS